MTSAAEDDAALVGGAVDHMIEANRAYAQRYHDPLVANRPTKKVTVVTCMDARLDLHAMLGLELGDAHLVRNAGGVVTDDVIRSLAVSQRCLGTRQVVLIHHTGCGMLQITEDGFKREIEAECGIRPPWAVEAFHDLEADLRQSMARVRNSPFLRHTELVRAFLYDVHTGLLTEVHES